MDQVLSIQTAKPHYNFDLVYFFGLFKWTVTFYDEKIKHIGSSTILLHSTPILHSKIPLQSCFDRTDNQYYHFGFDQPVLSRAVF